MGVQALGVLCVAAFAVLTMGVVFLAIKQSIGLRIGKEEELIEEIIDRVNQGLQSTKEFQRYLENYWKKGRLTKLANKILQWTDDLTYAKESAETLLINMEHLIQTLHRAETLI